MSDTDLNPFSEATRQVFQSMVGLAVIQDLPFIKTEGNPFDISGNIGLTGNLSGAMTLCMPESMACQITSRILGEPMDGINEMVADSVGELANVIAGKVKKLINDQGLQSKITLPTVIVGPAHDLGYPPGAPCHVIPFRIPELEQDFCLEVCYKKA